MMRQIFNLLWDNQIALGLSTAFGTMDDGADCIYFGQFVFKANKHEVWLVHYDRP